MEPLPSGLRPLFGFYDLIRLHRWNDIDGARPLGKAPIDKAWTTIVPLTPQEAMDWMRAGNNVGVRLAVDDLVVDIDPRNYRDGDSRERVARDVGIRWDDYPCVETPSGGRHYYMKIPAGIELRKDLPEFPGVEFKTRGGQVVSPGSVHPNGKLYEWDIFSPGFPAAAAPVSLIGRLQRGGQVVGLQLTGTIEPGQAMLALKRVDPEHFRRHDRWFAMMCAIHEATGGAAEDEFVQWSVSDEVYAADERQIRMRWRSLTVGRTGAAGIGTLEKLLIEEGVTEMPWRDAAADFATVDDQASAPVEKTLMEQISEEFFCVDEAGKFRVYCQQYDATLSRKRWERYPKREFLDIGESVMMWPKVETQSGDRVVMVPAAKYWLERYRKKRTYRGITFAPEIDSDRTASGQLNLWRGFAVAPAFGLWTLLQELIRDVICRGDAESEEYVMNWLARAIQRPEIPGEVALVIKGGKGVGKGTLGRAFVRLFGHHGLQVNSPGQLTGRFNAHLRDVVALFADEAFWAGDKPGESVLKGLVTEPQLMYEGKGANAEVGRNCVHIIMASNSDWVVPAGMDRERRFAVFETVDYVRDRGFYAELHQQLEAGGYSAMLRDLMDRDISKFEVRDVPMTEALLEQKIATMDMFETWLLEMVDSGFDGISKYDPPHTVPPGWTTMLIADLQTSFSIAHRKTSNRTNPLAVGPHFGHRLRHYFPSIVRRRIARPNDRVDVDATRPWTYSFPPRHELMEHMKGLFGSDPFKEDWDTNDQDSDEDTSKWFT